MKAALFDFDGVVCDTESHYSTFWHTAGAKYAPSIPDFADRIKGTTLTQIFDRYFANQPETQAALVQALGRFERDMPYEWVPGVQEFVAALRREGIRTAVVTSSNRPKMAAVRQRHPELPAMFDTVLTAEDFAASKPDPDCFLRAAARFGAAPADCVVFEDSFNGLKAGRAANMYVVGLATTNPAAAIAPYADHVIKDFRQFGTQQLRQAMAER